jgi:Family of unknown function (DUF6069)
MASRMGSAAARSGSPEIDTARLWVGGALAGLVAAGVAIVGLLVARGVFDIRVFVPGDKGGVVNASTWWYAAASFGAAILATALMHVLLLAAPSPFRFFGWLIGLAVAIAVIIPFTSSAQLANKIGTAVINLAIGVSIYSIVSSVGRSAATRGDEQG